MNEMLNGILLISSVIVFCRMVKNKAILEYKKTLAYNCNLTKI